MLVRRLCLVVMSISLLLVGTAIAHAQEAWIDSLTIDGAPAPPGFAALTESHTLECSGGARSYDPDQDITVSMWLFLDGQQIGFDQKWGLTPTTYISASVDPADFDRNVECHIYGPGVEASAFGTLLADCDTQEKTNIRREYYDFDTAEKPLCGSLRDDYHGVYFSFAELNNNGYHSVAWIDNVLVDGLDETRNMFGRAFTLSNAYRCPEKNRDVGSQFQQTSRHMFGRAADMIPVGEPITQQWRDDIAAAARTTGAQTVDEGNTVHMEFDH